MILESTLENRNNELDKVKKELSAAWIKLKGKNEQLQKRQNISM